MGLFDPISHLNFFITRRCQLVCRYCPVRKENADMSLEVALKAADFLLGCKKPAVTIEFYGGEPLLAYGLLQKCADHAILRGDELGKKVSFFLATNALLLDEAKLEWMAPRDFLVELSWDGAPKTHNHERASVPGGPDSYKALRKIVGKVLRSGVKCSVLPVATPENAGNLAENVEHLLDLGIRSLDLSYAVGVHWDRKAQETYFTQVRRVAARHRKALATEEIRIGNLWPEAEPGLINPVLTADTDGRLRPLCEWIFETAPPDSPSPRDLGSVMDDLDINDLYMSRFHCAHSILRMYAGNPRIRKIILNNVAFGFRHREFFTDLRKWVARAIPGLQPEEPAPPRAIKAYRR